MRPGVTWRRLLVLVVLAAVASAGAFILHRSDPQGEESPYCEQYHKASLSNGAGMTVSTHSTVCTTLGTDIGAYVYVHPSDEPPTTSNLVFRYWPSSGGDGIPTVRWIDTQHLLVEANGVGGTSKRIENFGSVSITYRIMR